MCDQAVLELTGRILQVHKTALHSAALFLDLSKAFDTLNHTVLLAKMERYGIRELVKDWFSSYPNNRSLVAKVLVTNNRITYSDRFDTTYGTAQGSCLGPLFFIIFCNDIHLLPLYGHLILFADDTTLINSQKTNGLLHFTMEHDLHVLSEWFKANQLSLNISKTVLMQFWPTQGGFEIQIDGQVVPCVNETKFLGVYIDNKLSWNTHTAMLYNKIQANKHLLWLATNFLDSDSLRVLYYAHIYSHLSYGISSWGSMASVKNLKSLYQLQKQCIRTVYNMSKRSDT